ncbi:MAG: hypothetical protein HY843_07320 [Bdellovibrio sp.]|nr:hypothetical protein [Bdellovibrio sp.]
MLEKGKPLDHAHFYLKPENLSAFDFLNNKTCQDGVVELPQPENIHSRLVISVTDFPAVAFSYNSA